MGCSRKPPLRTHQGLPGVFIRDFPAPDASPPEVEPRSRLGLGQCLNPPQLACSPAGYGNFNLGGRDAALRGSAERHGWSGGRSRRRLGAAAAAGSAHVPPRRRLHSLQPCVLSSRTSLNCGRRRQRLQMATQPRPVLRVAPALLEQPPEPYPDPNSNPIL